MAQLRRRKRYCRGPAWRNAPLSFVGEHANRKGFAVRGTRLCRVKKIHPHPFKKIHPHPFRHATCLASPARSRLKALSYKGRGDLSEAASSVRQASTVRTEIISVRTDDRRCDNGRRVLWRNHDRCHRGDDHRAHRVVANATAGRPVETQSATVAHQRDG